MTRALAHSKPADLTNAQATILITIAHILACIQYSLGVNSGPKSRQEYNLTDLGRNSEMK